MKKFKSSLAALALTGAMALSSIASLSVHAANYSALIYNTYPESQTQSSSTVESRLELMNTSTELYLPQVTIRYYFSNDDVDITNDNIDTFCSYAADRDGSPSYSNVDVKVKEIKDSLKTDTATHYIEVSFKATGDETQDHLPAGHSLIMDCGITAKEGLFDCTNDDSYNPQTGCNHLAPNGYVSVYWLDQAIWCDRGFAPANDSYVQ